MLEEAANFIDNGTSALEDFRGLWFYGTKENNVFCGADAQGMGIVRVQVRPCSSKCEEV